MSNSELSPLHRVLVRWFRRLICVAMASTSACAARGDSTSSLYVCPGPEGDILVWLVAGPYPNEGALQLRGTGFRTDYLEGEAKVSPKEGDRNGAHSWKLAVGNRKLGLDLKAALPTNDPAIGYCFTTLVSPRDQEALLLFGSDDGAKVYLNGQEVFSRQIARGIKRDEERVSIHLREGENALLFKVEQGDGGWGLMPRVVKPDGTPLSGLKERLRIDPARTDYSFLRRYAGKSNVIDAEAWQTYETSRNEASKWLERMRSRAEKPEALDQALSQAAAQFASLSDDPLVASKSLREMGQTVIVAFRASRAPLLKWAQNPGPFTKADPANEDFVSVMPGGRYFVHSDGKPFIPVGFNHNPDWPELEESNPLNSGYDPKRTDAWFAKIKAHGVNVVRLMVETPPSGNLEEVPGTFRPEHVIWLDHVFQAARTHGIKLWVTPYDTFWMSFRAETCPYWAANGGPIVQPIDFLTKPAILDLQKRRLKFLIDRYGNTGTIFAWEVMNEIDLWWKASPEQIKAWLDNVVPYVRRYQKERWGRNHLVTVSFADSEPKGLNAETAFRRSDLDFATMHLYLGASRATKPGEAEKAGADFASGVLYARSQIRDNRPAMDGESGPIDKWIADVTLDNETFHQMSWSHLLAGGAGPGTRWPYRGPHRVTDGMLESLRSMATFCGGVNWKEMTGPTVDITGSGGVSSVLATDKAGVAWFRHVAGKTIRISANRVQSYHLFDVRNGKWMSEVVTSSEGYSAAIPEGVDEVAVAFARS